MHPCKDCQSRSMVRHVADGRVTFACSCGSREEGGGRDRLIKRGGVSSGTQIEKYRMLIAVAPFSRAVLRVSHKCTECNLPYMTMVRVGDEETIILACTCGARKKVE